MMKNINAGLAAFIKALEKSVKPKSGKTTGTTTDKDITPKS